MGAKFEFSDEAEKAIDKLDTKMAGRIIKGIIRLPKRGNIAPLSGKLEGKFRLKIGDWRVIFYQKAGIITIDNIVPRGDAYK
jgi:mRNA-degrading endonuclease RelE of RelBE toxin-antitoxin system